MSEPYDLRSNIKNKPGSQGTLFQVKDKGLLNPQQRWPQGYTPERLNEVRKASPYVAPPSHLYDMPDYEAQEEHGVNSFGYRDRVHREIAKTTIPTQHLDRLNGITGDPDEDTHGTYWKGGAKDRNVAVDLTARTPDEARKTLVHEIGHHVNMTLAPTPHVHTMVAQLHATNDATRQYENGEREHWTPTETDIAMKRSVVAKNVDEAQADDYAVEHFRTGGRKSKGTTTGAYEDTFTAHERKKNYPGYNDIREPQQTPLQDAQFHTQQGQGMLPLRATAAQSPLQRRLAAQADATRHAIGENLR